MSEDSTEVPRSGLMVLHCNKCEEEITCKVEAFPEELSSTVGSSFIYVSAHIECTVCHNTIASVGGWVD